MRRAGLLVLAAAVLLVALFAVATPTAVSASYAQGPSVAPAQANNTTSGTGGVGVLEAFVIVGGVFAIGFFAGLVFELTRIPDILILIFLGLLLGPIAAAYFGVTVVSPGLLGLVTPYFTALALMMILFDGGLNLRWSTVAKGLGAAGLQTAVAFILSVLAISFVTVVILGYDPLVGILLGAILGGTSSPVIIGVVRPLRVGDTTKIILTLESILTDVLCIVTVLGIIELLRGGPNASALTVLGQMGLIFAIALATGAAVGFAWFLLLGKLERTPFSYMLTIAILFALYAGTELLGGSGAIAAFMFGLILGNHQDMERRLQIKGRRIVDQRIRQFHSELAFLVRTFFFVFLGVVFTLELSGACKVSTVIPELNLLNGTFSLLIVGVTAMFLAIIAVRVVASRLTAAVAKIAAPERRLLWALMGRGLAATVLASLPFTITAFTAPVSAGDIYYHNLLAPYEAQFLNIAFFIILLTVGGTTVGAALSERTLGKLPVPAQAAPGADLVLLHSLDLEDFVISDKPPRTSRARTKPPAKPPVRKRP